RTPPTPSPTLFPYTTLFRSSQAPAAPAPSNAATAVPIQISFFMADLARPRTAGSGEPSATAPPLPAPDGLPVRREACYTVAAWADRKSTRLNSSHDQISYAV